MDSGSHLDNLSHILGLEQSDGMPVEGLSSARAPEDYYRDADNTNRSTVLGCEHGGMLQPTVLKGDFYAPADDVLRGVTIDPEFGMVEDFTFAGTKDSAFVRDPRSKVAALTSDLSPACTFFSDGDYPSLPPDDELYSFTGSTLFLLCEVPFALGNRVLDFLLNEMTTSITKVNRVKFCIKADVFIGNVMCTTKIRFWKHSFPGAVAVEFQRRRGDLPTFNSMYQRASNFLQSHFPPVGKTPPVISQILSPLQPELPSPCLISKGDTTFEIGPLVDMALQINNPAVQAESAIMLANLAEHDQKATVLCTSSTVDAIITLLSSDSIEVALPTASLMLCLAKYTKAIPFFVGQEATNGFLGLCIDKLCAHTLCTSVRRILAKAVAIAIDACAAQLSQDRISHLASSIDAALRATSKERESPQNRPGEVADTDAIDRSLRDASTVTRFAMQQL